MFPNAQLENLVTLASDHYPILLNLEIIIRVGAHRNFKYENAWIVKLEFGDIVKESWWRTKRLANVLVCPSSNIYKKSLFPRGLSSLDITQLID